ncbi:MAG: general secretion pathway protein GspB [Caldimonas sp.]
MSYILDALRRADAERERGAVPSLQSQQHTIAEDDAAAASARPHALVWAVVALAVALLAVLAWNFFGGAAAVPRAPIEGSITPPLPAPLPTLRPESLPTTTAAPAGVTGTITTAPAAPTAAVAPTPMPAATPAIATAPPAPRAGADARRGAARRVGAASAAGAGLPSGQAKGAVEARVYSQAELPEEIRRDLPKIVIGGSSYSGDAASRMVMINGQVFHEGDRLGPGLVLDRIRLKSAVLAFKGWRYEVPF